MKIGSFYLLKYQLSDLKTHCVLNEEDILKLRKKFEILFIDDEEIAYLENLKSNGFNVTYKTNITDIKDVSAYDIIMCDINGVGEALGKDGASMAAQIKNVYPNKVVISYSAALHSFTYQKTLEFVDKRIPKGTSIEDWLNLLDEIIEENSNPIRVWNKTEQKLLKANISTREIAELESKYVEAIIKEKFNSLEKLSNSGNVIQILKTTIPFLIQILKTIQAGS
mgnify:CR=1 FL=1